MGSGRTKKKNRPQLADSPYLVLIYIMGQNSRPRVPRIVGEGGWITTKGLARTVGTAANGWGKDGR